MIFQIFWIIKTTNIDKELIQTPISPRTMKNHVMSIKAQSPGGQRRRIEYEMKNCSHL